MKRFYIQIFKAQFPNMKPKKASASDYIDSCSQLLLTLKGFISANDHLKYYLVHLISNKLLDNELLSKEIQKSLNLLNTCLYSYSDKALTQSFDDSSLRLLFNYFYQNGQTFFRSQNNVQKNLTDYMNAFEGIFKKFNGPLVE